MICARPGPLKTLSRFAHQVVELVPQRKEIVQVRGGFRQAAAILNNAVRCSMLFERSARRIHSPANARYLSAWDMFKPPFDYFQKKGGAEGFDVSAPGRGSGREIRKRSCGKSGRRNLHVAAPHGRITHGTLLHRLSSLPLKFVPPLKFRQGGSRQEKRRSRHLSIPHDTFQHYGTSSTTPHFSCECVTDDPPRVPSPLRTVVAELAGCTIEPQARAVRS
jgi:hypothetical protein